MLYPSGFLLRQKHELVCIMFAVSRVRDLTVLLTADDGHDSSITVASKWGDKFSYSTIEGPEFQFEQDPHRVE